MPNTSDKENEAAAPPKYRKLDDKSSDADATKRKRKSLKKVSIKHISVDTAYLCFVSSLSRHSGPMRSSLRIRGSSSSGRIMNLKSSAELLLDTVLRIPTQTTRRTMNIL